MNALTDLIFKLIHALYRWLHAIFDGWFLQQTVPISIPTAIHLPEDLR